MSYRDLMNDSTSIFSMVLQMPERLRANYVAQKWIVLSILVIGLIGCVREPSLDFSQYNKTNIQRLRNSYGMFTSDNGRAPKDEAELKDFLKNNRPAGVRLKRMGITPEMIDGIFISERDNEPFKIRYEVNGRGDHAIVFENTGVNGKRLVAFYEPRELDSEEYEAYWSGKIKTNEQRSPARP